MGRNTCLLGILAFCLSLKVNGQFIVTPVPPETLSAAGVTTFREYFRDTLMKQDSLMAEYMLNHLGGAVLFRFRHSHHTDEWAYRKFAISPDSLLSSSTIYITENGKEVLFYEKLVFYKKNMGPQVSITREFDRGLHTIDTIPADPEFINQLILTIHKGDTVRRIRNLRKGNTKLYLVTEKRGGVWSETEKMLTVYKPDGNFDSLVHYKAGKLFQSYSWTDVDNKKKEMNNGWHENDNGLPWDPPPPAEKIRYTKNPFSNSPVFSEKKSAGCYVWIERFSDASSGKPFVIEVFDKQNLPVLKINTMNGDRITYVYSYRKKTSSGK
ncbi:MAG: hypothetical protein IT233_05010 [Bacteroidia bacterium]|nr:hypothetical protein [Bacteroidia bacterium]